FTCDFFFSSRRRHTRSKRDWSSDVCSSDLIDDVAEGLQSPILKYLTTEAIEGILARTEARTGDIIFFGADKASIVNEALGALRVRLGHDLNLLECEWAPLWVVDFRMFEVGEDGKCAAMRNTLTLTSC